MSDERLQGCIDECEQEIKALHNEMSQIRLLHAQEFAEIDKRLSVLESTVVGNGRPGLMSLIEKQTTVMESMNNRLSEIEHQSNLVKTRKIDIARTVGMWVAIVALAVSITFNLVGAFGG
jgi:hypothetical protein